MAKKKEEVFGLEPKVEVREKAEVEQYDYCFNLVKHNNKIEIAVGNTIVYPVKFDSVEEAKKCIDSKPWQLLIATIHVCMNILNKLNK